MPTNIESSGKTLDEAIRSGLSVLGVEREAVTVEILSKPKTGFFGIGSTLAKVKLTLTAPEKSAGRSTGFERPAHVSQFKKPAPANQQRTQRPPQQQQRPQTPPPPAAARQEPPAPAPRPAPRRATIPATDEDFKKATDFVTELLKQLDMGMTVTTGLKDGVIQINIDGEHVGNLIGRHGETLDAIQHIVTNVVNLKNDGVTVRVQVDAADYRSKRQAALEQLAHRMADNAKKYNSNMTLEPMNAYERHVIHSALQDVPGIATFSTGNEPQRRVVISSTAAPRRRSDNTRRPPRDNRNRFDDRRPPRDNFSPRPAPQTFKAASDDAPVPPPPPPRTLPVKEFGVKKS